MKNNCGLLVRLVLLLLVAAQLASCSTTADSVIYIDPSYVLYNNEDDTEYLDPVAPFVKVGTSILYLDRSYYWANRAKFYSNYSLMNGLSGKVDTVCKIDKCIHNRLDDDSYLCELSYLDSNLRVDEQGYIYGIYTEPELGYIYLLRYNIYTAQTNVIYRPEENLGEARRVEALGNAYLYKDKYIFFYQYNSDGTTDVMRYAFSGRETLNLTGGALAEIPTTLDVFDGRLYMLTPSGFYSYDLDMTPESKYTVFSTATETSPLFGKEIASIQYDKYMRNIYFIAREPGEQSGTLCKVRAYGDSYRRIRRTALTDVVTYQLTYDYIYYTKYNPVLRCVGIESEWDDESEFGYHKPGVEVEYYDYGGGKYYRVGYAEINEDVIEEHLVFETGDELYLANCTIIDSYMFGESLQLVPDNIALVKNMLTYLDMILAPVQRVRVDLYTGKVTFLDTITTSGVSAEDVIIENLEGDASEDK